MLDPRLLEILCCPSCDDRPSVRLDDGGLKCDRCGRIYPIRDGIPEMLVESATLPVEGAQGTANSAAADCQKGDL
jgi:Uncharacterized conserved protein